jgi:hypothetical protein
MDAEDVSIKIGVAALIRVGAHLIAVQSVLLYAMVIGNLVKVTKFHF